jgi:hypothetical protein
MKNAAACHAPSRILASEKLRCERGEVDLHAAPSDRPGVASCQASSGRPEICIIQHAERCDSRYGGGAWLLGRRKEGKWPWLSHGRSNVTYFLLPSHCSLARNARWRLIPFSIGLNGCERKTKPQFRGRVPRSRPSAACAGACAGACTAWRSLSVVSGRGLETKLE